MFTNYFLDFLCLLSLIRFTLAQTSPDSGNHDASSNTPSEPSNHHSTPAQDRYYNNIIIVHAVFACVAWSVLAPFGAIIIRALHSRWTFAIHTTIQLFVVAFFVIAVGLGIRISIRLSTFLNIWTDPHVVLGLCILGLALLNPLLGFVHHAIFVSRRRSTDGNDGNSRTVWAYIHLWLGRCLILAGMINGGLGFRLGLDSPKQNHEKVRIGVLAYSCVTVAMAVGWAVAAIRGEWKRKVQVGQRIEEPPEDIEPRGKSKREDNGRRRSYDTWLDEKGLDLAAEDGAESSRNGRRYRSPDRLRNG